MFATKYCKAASISQQMHSTTSTFAQSPSNISRSIALSLAIILSIILIENVNCQMTFSDGWGKRSVMMKEARRSANADMVHSPSSNFQNQINSLDESDKNMVNAALDMCHTQYSQSLVQLHQQIMKQLEESNKSRYNSISTDSSLALNRASRFQNHLLQRCIFGNKQSTCTTPIKNAKTEQ